MAATTTWKSFRAPEVKLRVLLIRPPKHVGMRIAPLAESGLNERNAILMSFVDPLANLKFGINKYSMPVVS